MMICAYNTLSGRITTVNYGTKGRIAFDDQSESTFVDDNIDPVAHFVSGNSLSDKATPSFAFDVVTIDADGIDTATISGIPAYTLVTWPDGETAEISDGVLEFAVDLAGTYTFTIDSVQHLKQEVTIEALATA